MRGIVIPAYIVILAESRMSAVNREGVRILPLFFFYISSPLREGSAEFIVKLESRKVGLNYFLCYLCNDWTRQYSIINIFD